MCPMLRDLYIDHLVFRVADLAATRTFYGMFFGEPLSENEGSVMYLVDDTRPFSLSPLRKSLRHTTRNNRV